MIVVVASSDMLGQLSSYSAFGKDVVSLAAPGDLILVFNTEAENEYCYDSGTSFAASHVTGALVLLLSAFPHCTVLRTYMHTLHGSGFRFHIYLKRIIVTVYTYVHTHTYIHTYIHTSTQTYLLSYIHCKVSQLVHRLLDTVDQSISLKGKCRSGGRLNIGNALQQDLTGDFGVLRSM